jgi:succinate-semialdehyde dehydrogenase/glutarate-semialdehyde dehydrogenase
MTIAQKNPQPDTHMPDIDAASRGLYIDGAWRPSLSGQVIDIVDPSTGNRLACVPDATIEDARLSMRQQRPPPPGAQPLPVVGRKSCVGVSS